MSDKKQELLTLYTIYNFPSTW